MKCLVSIIIPVYNTEKYIQRTVNSCLNQTYEHFEIIIVNDGSTDNSEELVQRIEDKRIRYFKIANSGPCVARNFGIEQAKGDLFQFLDADDILDEGKLQAQMESYVKYGDDYVYSGTMGNILAGVKDLEEGFEIYYKNLRVEDYFRTMFSNFGKYYTTGIWLTPRKLVEKTKGWDKDVLLNNDGEYFTRIILNSNGVIFCSDSIFYYRRDVPFSVSKGLKSRRIYESWLYSYKCYVENFHLYLEAKSARELSRQALSVYYCNSYPKYPELLRECKDLFEELGYRTPVAHGGDLFRFTAALLGVEKALKVREMKKNGFNTLLDWTRYLSVAR